MTQIFKLFVVKDEPYLTIDEDVKIGDKAIITVNGMFPSMVECLNDEQISLFQTPFTKMTKRHKVVMGPNDFSLEENIKEKIIRSETSVDVEFEDGKINILNQ